MLLKAYFWVRGRVVRQDGQGMTEYGLIIALIAVVLITVLTTMSKELGDTFKEITKALKAANK